MKLRNKKTGEIIILKDEGEIALLKLVESSLPNGLSLWEEVKEEPLIKDEKIRKAVRAWAEANGDTRVYYNRPTIEICINDKAGYVIRSIKFKSEYREAIDIESGYYTIAELCGEEE